MHEGTLINGLVRQLEEIATREKANKITAIDIRLGALSHFSDEHFREHFETASAGTIAEGAFLSIKMQTDPNDPNAQDVIIEGVEVEDRE